jgi:hypothetical protein
VQQIPPGLLRTGGDAGAAQPRSTSPPVICSIFRVTDDEGAKPQRSLAATTAGKGSVKASHRLAGAIRAGLGPSCDALEAARGEEFAAGPSAGKFVARLLPPISRKTGCSKLPGLMFWGRGATTSDREEHHERLA